MDTLEVTVGRIGRAHGLRGEVSIEVRTDEPARRFVPGARLRLDDGRTVELEAVKWNRGKLQVTFVGHPDRTAVEPLNGRFLSVEVPTDEQPSEAEEYFDRQLVGLRVLSHEGREVGLVTDVLHLPAQEVLAIDVDGEQRLVPFVTALVPDVDLAAGTVTLADVAGLLEDLE